MTFRPHVVWLNYSLSTPGVLIRPQTHKNKKYPCWGVFYFYGGWGGIRTPGGVAPTTVFKTAAFDRSATHPKLFLPTVFQPTGTFSAYNYNLSDILFQAFYSYIFFLIEYKNKPNPHANIIPDNNCPIVKPQLVKNPI